MRSNPDGTGGVGRSRHLRAVDDDSTFLDEYRAAGYHDVAAHNHRVTDDHNDACPDNDCCPSHYDHGRRHDFLDNATAIEHYLHDAVANYQLPAPWGCLLGVLRGPRRLRLPLRLRRR